MTLSTIDERPALVLIDLQKGIATLPTVHPFADVARRATQLAAAFRASGAPVVMVNVTGGAPGRVDATRPAQERPADWIELIDELEAQDGDYFVTKQRWGAFHGTTLDEYLHEHDVTQIFLAGVSTSIGVESTARSAFEHGYNVVLVTDAMTDTDVAAHLNSVERIFPRLGEVTTTGDVLALMTAHH
ncbi:MAG TPA: isochorismatase family protein [Acidimicrobiales bacterium]|nr:isochorismatase family protein [Acidimicrobiales bacterium]